MSPLLYGELVDWYRLIDPYEDHLDEADVFTAAFERVCPEAVTLLELGAGAGHNGFHMKRRYRTTLTDLSAPMSALSRALNPDCEHVLGDMRTLRLARTFDVVLVHDAICYMLTQVDLRAAVETAWTHTRPGGAAIFAPDAVREAFVEGVEQFGHRDGQRVAECMSWSWDPDPNDDLMTVDYAFFLREGAELRAVHDRHVEGLFSRATWRRLFAEVGFEVEPLARPLGDGAFDEVFLCRRR